MTQPSENEPHRRGRQAVHDNIEVLDPDLVAAIGRYEAALMDNDAKRLSAMFADDPGGIPVVRSDAKGMIVGHNAIGAFRKARKNAPTRRLISRVARRLGDTAACVVSRFEKASGGIVVQTQVWQRCDDVWGIVAAHLTYPAPAIDSTIWRVAGTPLVEATHPGPLSGMGVAVKDLYAVAGQRVGAGNPAYLAEAPVQEHSAPAVQRLLDAGANIVGIARTDEFAYSLAGANAHYGTPPNPKAVGRVPGGSSSGPASAVASGQAAIGLGTDTAGSIRIPSAYQGLWGLRTTHDRVSREGVHPLSESFDTVGWMTRDAQTMDFVTQAMLPDRDTARLSGEVAVCALPGQMVDADVAQAFSRSCDAMHDAALAGVHGQADMWGEITLDAGMFDGFLDAFSTVRGYEAWRANGGWVAGHMDALAPDIAERFRRDILIDEAAYRRGLERLERSRAMIRSLVGGKVLLMPTAATVAPTLGEQDDAETAARTRTRTMRLTSLAGVGGLPALTMPITTEQGLPCGVCLIGPAGSDKALVAFAKELCRRL
ncbi:AtzH-like domain-containing protein [Bifidobacterium sp.]|uniref:AtzH-like domain-containing protein n=1 Tax=Bifidobacterium sp. TaxID=41200 RepID=UPI002A90E77C|nr:AtzH-like domain-containing protein [Bifidobacterium sp.]MDY5368446.1 DUF3225 domain-containing protein [Bifidobacterium sp.]